MQNISPQRSTSSQSDKNSLDLILSPRQLDEGNVSSHATPEKAEPIEMMNIADERSHEDDKHSDVNPEELEPFEKQIHTSEGSHYTEGSQQITNYAEEEMEVEEKFQIGTLFAGYFFVFTSSTNHANCESFQFVLYMYFQGKIL
jgi:hypothetical protein